MADTNNDFTKLVNTLVKHFSNNKQWPYYIRLYKNVPVSHIRVSNPERNYIRKEEYYIQYFQSLTIEKVTSLLNILNEALNTNSIFTVEDEELLLKLPSIMSLSNDDIDILKTITQLLRNLVFADDMDENEKFRDPIKACLSGDNRLSVHPGKKRLGVLEYLFLKNKKEYYIDVIYYKSKDAEISDNHDGFLIDKEYTHIKSLDGFAKAYGYKSPVDLIMDVKNMNVAVCVDSMNHYYLNKHTAFSKEKFIRKFPKVLKLCSE
jgi:hypothetical protein